MLDSALRIRLHRPICTAAVLCSLVGILTIAAVGLWMAFSDVPIMGAAEPNAVYTIEKYLAGQPIYGDPDQPPFDITQYSPLFYVVAGAAGKLLGIVPTDPSSVLRLGRLTAFGFSVVLLCLQYRLLTGVLLVRKAITVPAMAYSYVAICPYLFYARPDTALALTTIACFYFVFKSITQTGAWADASIAAGTVSAVLAVMSKQSGIVVLGILFTYLLVSRQYRFLFVATMVLFLCVVLGAVSMGSLDTVRVIKANVIDGLDNGVSLYHGVIGLFIPYARSEAMLIAATGFVVLCWLDRRASRTELLFAISLPLLFGFAAITSLKEGSGANYYDEFALLATTAVAYAVQQRFDHTQAPGIPDRLATALALFIVLVIPLRTLEKAYLATYGRSETNSLTPLRSTQYAAYEDLAEFVSANTGPGEYVLTYDRALMTMIPSRCITPQTELAASRYLQGLSDMRGFRALVMAGQVKYVVFLREEIWPEYLGVRFLDYFEHARDFPNQVVYRYRGRTK